MAKLGEASVKASFDDVATYPSRISKFRVEARSQFEGDNRWTYELISDQAQHLIVSSYEHLNMLRGYVLANGGNLPAMSGYTLVRSSIESAALTLWLTTGGTRDKRILRSLSLSMHNAWDMESFATKAGISDQVAWANVQTAVIEAKDQRGSLRQRGIPAFPKWSQIVESIASSVDHQRALSGIQAWKGASGIAHSNQALTSGLLQHGVSTRPDGTTGRIMSTRISTFSVFLSVALRHLNAASLEFERAGQKTQ
jgi:hypothetical protein